jgi:hypothetical protein
LILRRRSDGQRCSSTAIFVALCWLKVEKTLRLVEPVVKQQ